MKILKLLKINKNKNITPPTLKNKRVDEYITEAKKLIKDLHNLQKEVYNTLPARDNDYFFNSITNYKIKLKYKDY